MNHRPTPYLLAAIVLGILVAPAYAQFGKNKVNYKIFKWSYIQSKHFDVYTYEGGDDIAAFTADVAEETLL